MPANKNERFERHSQHRVGTFQEYQARLKKIRAQAEEATRQRKVEQYDELFERYNVPMDDRNYVFLSDLQRMNPDKQDFFGKAAEFSRLAERIPEIYFELAKPTADDLMASNLRRLQQEALLELTAIEAARKPLIEQQLKERRAQFEKESSALSADDKEIAWSHIADQLSARAVSSFDKSLENFWDGQSDMLQQMRQSIPEMDKTPVELLIDYKY